MSARPFHLRAIRRSGASLRRLVLAGLAVIPILLGIVGTAPASGEGVTSGKITVESPGNGDRVSGAKTTYIVLKVTSSPGKVTTEDLQVVLVPQVGKTITPKVSAGPATATVGGGWEENVLASADLSDNLGSYTVEVTMKVKGATIASITSKFVVGVPISLADAVIERSVHGDGSVLHSSQLVTFEQEEAAIGLMAPAFVDPSTGEDYSVYGDITVNVLRQVLGTPGWGAYVSFSTQVTKIEKVLAALSWRAVVSNDDETPAGGELVKYATTFSGDKGTCGDATNERLVKKAGGLALQARDHEAAVWAQGDPDYKAVWSAEDYLGMLATGDFHGPADPTIEVDLSHELDVVPLAQVQADDRVGPIDKAVLLVSSKSGLGLLVAGSSNPPDNMSAAFQVFGASASFVVRPSDWDAGVAVGKVTFTPEGSTGRLDIPVDQLTTLVKRLAGGSFTRAALVINVIPEFPPPGFPPKIAELTSCGLWDEYIIPPSETLIYHQNFPSTSTTSTTTTTTVP
jgi:hypothetical protein